MVSCTEPLRMQNHPSCLCLGSSRICWVKALCFYFFLVLDILSFTVKVLHLQDTQLKCTREPSFVILIVFSQLYYVHGERDIYHQELFKKSKCSWMWMQFLFQGCQQKLFEVPLCLLLFLLLFTSEYKVVCF